MPTTTKLMTPLLALLLLPACLGTGAISVSTYGEDYIEREIPADASADGTSVRFTRFLLALSELRIADRAGEVAAELREQRIYDLTQPGPHAVTTFAGLEAKRWDDVGVTIRPAQSALAGNASAEDVARMNMEGASVRVEGEVSSPVGPRTFAWSFSTTTVLRACEEDSGAAGIVVPSGGTADLQLTVHGDHFFYDGLQNPEALIRGEAIVSADADANGEVTLEELERVDLTTLPPERYETGGDGAVTNLREFVTALSRTLVHFQGEGECVISR